VQVAISADQFIVLVATIIGAGWFLPIVAGSLKTKRQLKRVKECINQIHILNKNALEDKIKRYFVDGKISEDQRQFLRDQISEYYKK
jgi:hypothetical protein